MKEKLVHKIQKYEEEKLKEEAQHISVREGSAYSLMDGFGVRYMTPYALTLGATNTHIGILTSLPHLIGSISELFAIKEMSHVSRKKMVFWGVLLQALMWLVIIGVGTLFFIFNIDHTIAPISLIIAFTLLILFGTFPVPAWTSWMRDIVPRKYNEYFGMRNRIIGVTALAGMLIAGYILDYFKTQSLFLGFVILFFIAFAGRFTSALFFLKQYEPRFTPEKNNHLPFWKFVKHISENNFGRHTLFISLMTFAVAIASPFFAVYMLKELNFDYVTFTVVSIVSELVLFLLMPAWGKFADKYGNKTVLTITGIMIPLVPFLWLAPPLLTASMLVPYLLVVQVFSGFAWSGFTLSTSDFIYDMATPKTIGSFITYFNILNNFGMLIGALIGGILSSLSFNILGLTPLLFIFLLSGIVRFIIAATQIPHLEEVKHVKQFTTEEAKYQFLHLSPGRIIKILK
jgi:MFS family permease